MESALTQNKNNVFLKQKTIKIILLSALKVTSHYPQVAAARIKSDNGGILLSPSSLSLR